MELYYIHSGQIDSQSPSMSFILNRIKGFEKSKIKIKFILSIKKKIKLNKVLCEKYNVENKFKYVEIQLVKIKNQRDFYRKIKNILKNNSKEKKIILTRTIGLIPSLMRTKKKYNSKIYYESHDFFYDLKLRKDIKRYKKTRQNIIEKIYFKKLNGLVCVSEAQKKLYEKYLNIPIKAIPCGMDKVEIQNEDKENILAYIGSLDIHKGIDNIISIVKILPETYKILIIGGKNKQEIEELNQKLRDEKIIDKVKITGWVNKKELKNYLKKVKVGLVPLVDNFFNRYLTSPLKIYDFMLYGIPVIASDFPTIREFIIDKKTGYLFDWKDEKKIKEIIETIENPLHYKKIIDENKKNGKRLENSKKSMELFEFLISSTDK
ncbi:MAG: hypothetical protein B6I28_04075 [Fusobacteriia bacterium 4572_132]|nr:MAG: hypothetical protein B6I28_04075 [Fusobacteriia bacterium 4572_132]